TNGVANPNDRSGTLAVKAGAGSDLQSPSGGFMVDGKTNVFVCQERDSTGDSANRVLLFTNWTGTNPLTTASWAVGSNDDSFRYDFDLSIDSRVNPNYVACAMYNGLGIRLLKAADGSLVTNLNVGTSYMGTAWDNVGNLYAAAGGLGGSGLHRWQVFSPPGTNQASTAALNTIQVTAAQAPVITSIAVSGGMVTIYFTGATNDSPSVFALRNATSVDGPYWNAPGATITQISPGVFQATAPVNFA